MKKLLQNPDGNLYVLYKENALEFLYIVDSTKPIMLSRIIEHGIFLKMGERETIIDELGEFVEKELERLSDGF